MKPRNNRPGPRAQRGITVVVVLVLLSVMVIGGLALARVTETGTLVFGNVAAKDGSVQASEVGINKAYARINTAGFAQDADQPNWYWASIQATDANGIPPLSYFDNSEKINDVAGRYTVSYVVERMCNSVVVSDVLQQCLVRLQDSKVRNTSADAPKIAPSNRRQFRITVRVTDTRGTTTWVQTLATVKS